MTESKKPQKQPEIEPQMEKASRKSQIFKVFGLVAVVVLIILVLLTNEVGREQSKSQCLKCHSEYEALTEAPFVHTAFQRETCTRCHTSHGEVKTRIISVKYVVGYLNTLMRMLTDRKEIRRTSEQSFNAGQHPKKISKLVEPQNELCNSCHQKARAKSWAKAKYKHPPYKSGTCTVCHNPHADKYIGVTREAPDKLCVSCHNVTERMRKKVLHPPFKAKRCADCHEPHASNVENHLRLPQKELCRTCHPQIAQLFKLAYKMEPFEKGQCTKCHNPHSSDYQKLWQKGPKAADLCFSCHDGSDGSDIKQYSKAAYQMQPFKEGRCLECHKPHATPDPKLLKGKGNDFCYKCHGEYKKNYLPISHNKLPFNKNAPNSPLHGKGSCLNCHVPHGSQWLGLVYKEIISLCTTCHNPNVYRGYKRDIPKPHIAHPVGFDIGDPWGDGYLRCSSCHNPMGSGFDKLLRKKGDGLCIQCHNTDDSAWIRGRKKQN